MNYQRAEDVHSASDVMAKDEMLKLLQEQFSDIWDCEIDHRCYQDTVGEILTEAVEIITERS